VTAKVKAKVKIDRIECLAADGGWRTFDFVKITLSDGLVGWSEFSRALGGPGVVQAIDLLATELVGQDPRSARVGEVLNRAARQTFTLQQACGALANGLLDVKGRSLGVPVSELLGNRLRERVPVYWAHCGTYRVSHAGLMQRPPLQRLEDLVELGREVRAGGYSALKTNLLLFGAGRAWRYAPRSQTPEAPLTASPELRRAMAAQLEALRAGAGEATEIMVDLGGNFRADGALRMAQAIEPYAPAWLELELQDPGTLRHLRDSTRIPIAAGERLMATGYQSLLRAGAVDVAVVDVLFNGLQESQHVAAAASVYDTNVAVHNCYSPLATMIAAAYCAVVPNLQILECDVDQVPWAADLVTRPPAIEAGYLSVPDGPGWGTEVNEDAVRAHAVRHA
jgi:L-alanine-DL-glutamate epimerase-like enolase superfamily enzyme